ncbi:putative leucine-rich repeat-containing protein [Aphis craccivora]|uniref:Putative leucine-rich repeat-containing protein n=1 Tax=Aphis craccivora TaxID=307492 RepID=A0A6G0Z2I9_APHCR|nr:putative leucine-rich repeat-containing protein [Aphis craccivora]
MFTYGFGLVRGSIEIHATFMNQKIITPKIPVHQNELKITSDIIWYMNNASLKKSKMSNTSIRVECFHIPINKTSSNEKLGYLLLKLKGAQTINPISSDRIDIKPYKLIGSKSGSYELNLSLRIEDFNDKVTKTLPEKIQNTKSKNKNDLKIVEDYNHTEKNIEIVSPKSDENNMLGQIESLPKNNKPQNVFNFDVQQRLIEELEDWKEKQMILFNEKMKMKEEQLLKDFNNKWSDDRKHNEEKLTCSMSKCKELAKDLDNMSDKLKERDAIVTAKELELTCQKDSMDHKYIDLVQNIQSSNAQTINDMSNKIFELETQLHESEKLNDLLRRENEVLKYNINTNCGLQVKELEKNISNLESKIEEANKSCRFFKERWITSIRKLNELYTKFHEAKTNNNLLNTKQNIQNKMNDKLEERKQDELKLRTLLNDLGKLRQDMTNTNYLVL